MVSTPFPGVMLPLPTLGGFMLVTLQWVISIWSPVPGRIRCSCWWFLLPLPRIHSESLQLCLVTFFLNTFFIGLQLHVTSQFTICSAFYLCQVLLLHCLLPLKPAWSSSRSAFLQLSEWFIAEGSPVPAQAPSHHPIPALLRTTPHISTSRPLLLYQACISLHYVLGQSHKYLILHRITACYCYLYKPTAALYKRYTKVKQISHSHLVN